MAIGATPQRDHLARFLKRSLSVSDVKCGTEISNQWHVPWERGEVVIKVAT